MAYGLSNGHVTDDVKWPWKLVTPMRLERNMISKTAGDRDSIPMTYGVSNGHVIDDVTWPPKVLWGSTVVYPIDSFSLASCSEAYRNLEWGYLKKCLVACDILWISATYVFKSPKTSLWTTVLWKNDTFIWYKSLTKGSSKRLHGHEGHFASIVGLL